MTASPIRSPRAVLVLAGLLALAAAAPALAVPTISGADGDVWNASQPEPTYTITASAPRLRIFWQVAGEGSGSGGSPLTVKLGDLGDGAYRLQASEGTRDTGFISSLSRARAFRVDTTPPTITITKPADRSMVPQGAVLLADYACADAVSCSGPVAPGAPVDTGTAGLKAFRVTARDDAGNEATLDAGYTVVAPEPPAPPSGTTAAPVDVVPRPAPVAALTINARVLHPRRGAMIATRRPFLVWPRLARARLYNLQLFRLRDGKAVKVLSVFPRRTRYRVPPRTLALGGRYIWRVWPYLHGGYPKRPLGLSFFTVRSTRAR